MLRYFIQLYSPPRCVLCSAKGSYICEQCARGVADPRAPHCYRCGALSVDWRTCGACRRYSVIDALISTGPYVDQRKALVLSYKHQKRRVLARGIASILAAQSGLFHKEFIVSYVPSARTRIRQRGFDHAAHLARWFAKTQQLGFRPLLRRLGSDRQTGKDRRIRMEQAFSAYEAAAGALPEKVVLIDDVVSSGATVEAAVYMLKQAGVKTVVVVCVARSV